MTKRTPAQYQWDKALFNDRRLSKHFTSPRRSTIKTVTLHHSTIVGDGDGAALETMYRVWQTREASANYGVDGKQVWQYVSDNDAAWANASSSNHETLSIEHTDATAAPTWKISDTTMDTGARLVAALHRLYGLGRPSRKTVKMHRDYYATACPGPYMVAHLADYIANAGRWYDKMGHTPAPAPSPDPKPTPATTVKITSVVQNLAGAAANTHGVRTAQTRVKRWIRARKNVPITSALLQEVNTAMLDQLDNGLTGFQHGVGGHGRYIYLSTGRNLIDHGCLTAPKSYRDDTKQCAWAVYTTRGALSCEGSMHLENRDGATADKVRVQQAVYFADQLLAKAKANNVPLGNVMLAGDTNSNGMVVAALTAKGWRNIAAGTKYENEHTFMGWDGRAHERFDYVLVYDGPGATPVKAGIVALARNTDISDHAGLRVVRHLTK